MTAFSIMSIAVEMPLTKDQWTIISQHDHDVKYDLENEKGFISEIVENNNELYVWDVDYKDHFGMSIFFRTDSHANAEKVCLYIESLLK